MVVRIHVFSGRQLVPLINRFLGYFPVKFSVTGPTKVVIVLSKHDDRYFRDLCGRDWK